MKQGEGPAQGQVGGFDASFQEGEATAHVWAGFVRSFAGRQEAADQVFDAVEVQDGQIPVVLLREPSGHQGNLEELDALLLREGGWIEPSLGKIFEVGWWRFRNASLFQVAGKTSGLCEQDGGSGHVEPCATRFLIRVEQPRPKRGPHGDRAGRSGTASSLTGQVLPIATDQVARFCPAADCQDVWSDHASGFEPEPGPVWRIVEFGTMLRVRRVWVVCAVRGDGRGPESGLGRLWLLAGGEDRFGHGPGSGEVDPWSGPWPEWTRVGNGQEVGAGTGRVPTSSYSGPAGGPQPRDALAVERGQVPQDDPKALVQGEAPERPGQDRFPNSSDARAPPEKGAGDGAVDRRGPPRGDAQQSREELSGLGGAEPVHPEPPCGHAEPRSFWDVRRARPSNRSLVRGRRERWTIRSKGPSHGQSRWWSPHAVGDGLVFSTLVASAFWKIAFGGRCWQEAAVLQKTIHPDAWEAWQHEYDQSVFGPVPAIVLLIAVRRSSAGWRSQKERRGQGSRSNSPRWDRCSCDGSMHDHVLLSHGGLLSKHLLSKHLLSKHLLCRYLLSKHLLCRRLMTKSNACAMVADRRRGRPRAAGSISCGTGSWPLVRRDGQIMASAFGPVLGFHFFGLACVLFARPPFLRPFPSALLTLPAVELLSSRRATSDGYGAIQVPGLLSMDLSSIAWMSEGRRHRGSQACAVKGRSPWVRVRHRNCWEGRSCSRSCGVCSGASGPVRPVH